MAYPSQRLLFLKHAVLADVAVGTRLDSGDHFQHGLGTEQMREAFLRLQIFLDRHLSAYRQRADQFAMLRFEHRKQAGLMRQSRDADGVMRSRAPTQWTRHEDMD